MRRKIFYIVNLFLSLLIRLSNSNFWDNIYTQADSPHFVLDDNFQISLLNSEENNIAGEILLSSDLGLIKFSIILSEKNINDSFIQVIINFNNGHIYFDTEEKCFYKYIDLIEQVNPKFIINAYDIFSYFSEDENYYHYIIANPLEISDSNNNIIILLAKEIMNGIENNLKKYKSIFDTNFYVDFIIAKKDNLFNKIHVKTSFGLMELKTEFKPYNSTIEQFNGIHNPSECAEYL